MARNERRQHNRYELKPAYTRLLVRPEGEHHFTLEGHAYDISIGGMRFELDSPIEPGSPVGLLLDLPQPSPPGAIVGSNLVAITGTVVWIDDDDAPGPVRMAAIFHNFESPADEERLAKAISTGRYAAAA